MGYPAKPIDTAVIEKFETAKASPDVQEYLHRRKVRAGHKSGEIIHKRARRANEVAKKAIRHKVVLQVSRGINSATEISKNLDVSPGMVKAVLQDRSFDKHLTTYQKGVLSLARYKMEDKLERAVDKLIQIMESGTPKQKIQLEAARDILDRCGAKAHEVIETVSRQYSPEETASMLEVAKEVESIVSNLSNKKSPYLIEKSTEAKKEPVKVSSGSTTPVIKTS